MCENYGISQPISHYPQSNAIIERVHKVVNDMLRSFDLKNEELEDDNPLTTSYNQLHGQANPCQLVF
jgi:hypothetical protein